LKDVSIERVGVCQTPAVPEAEFVLMKNANAPTASANPFTALIRSLAKLAKSKPEGATQDMNTEDQKTIADLRKQVETLQDQVTKVLASITDGAGKSPAAASAAASLADGKGDPAGSAHALKISEENLKVEAAVQKSHEDLQKQVADLVAKVEELSKAPAAGVPLAPVANAGAPGAPAAPAAPVAPPQEGGDLAARVAALEQAVADLISKLVGQQNAQPAPAPVASAVPQPAAPVVGKSRQVPLTDGTNLNEKRVTKSVMFRGLIRTLAAAEQTE